VVGTPDSPYLVRDLPSAHRRCARVWLVTLALLAIVALAPATAAARKHRDRDHDGLSDRKELRIGTSPRNRDSDGDGLSDGYEVRNSRTSPRRRDTDRDRLRDRYELRKSKTSPVKPDTDRDALLDGHEVKVSKTDPLRSDTDEDGYSDVAELLLGSNPRDSRSPTRLSSRGDKTPPETTILTGPLGSVSSSSATFSFTSSELGSTFQCKLDSMGWTSCASPKAYSGLALGSHTFSVRARDAAGNMDKSPATRSFTVVSVLPPPDTTPPDTTPPAVSVTAPTAAATVSNTITVTASASDSGGVAGVRFKLDGANAGSEDTSAPYSINWDTTTSLNGSHTLQAVARDAAGNSSTSPAVQVTVSNTAPLPPPPTGLVAAYSFNEGTGASAVDASGLGNTGILSGATWTTAGRFGGALSFDGVNDWVTVADSPSLDLTGGMTLEAWVKPIATTGWRTGILKETTSDLVYALYPETGPEPGPTAAPGSWIGQGSYVVGSGALPANLWSHVAATYDGGMWKLYVNGNEVASKPQVAAFATSSGPLRMGGNSVWGEWFQGTIDEVRVYNRGLSALEVASDRDTGVAGGTPPPPDTTPPDTTISSGPSGTVSTGDASFAFSSTESGSTFECRLDGGAWGGCTSPKSFISLVNGSHTFDVRAKDTAGNVDASPASRTWTVSVPPPPSGSCDLVVSTGTALLSAVQNLANGGKTVCAHAGDYGSPAISVRQTTQLTLKPYPGETATIGPIDLNGVDKVRFEGFDMPRGGFDTNHRGNSSTGSHNIEIVGNRIHDASEGALQLSEGDRSILFDHNLVRNIRYNGTYTSGWGVKNDGADDLKVRYNTFDHTENDAMELGEMAGFEIVGNVVQNVNPPAPPTPDPHADALMVWANSNNGLIKDNRFTDGNGVLMSGSTTDVRMENNLIARIDNWCHDGGTTGSSSQGLVRYTWIRNTIYDCGSDYNGGGFGGTYGLLSDGPATAGASNRVERNILASLSVDTGSQFSYEDYNVIRNGYRAGAHDLTTAPQFADQIDYRPTNLPAGYEDVGYRVAPAGHTAP